MCWAYQPLTLAASEEGGGNSLTAESGSFLHSGQIATFAAARRLAASTGVVTTTGQEATLRHVLTFGLDAEAGHIAVSGMPASPLRGLRLNAGRGVFAVSSQGPAGGVPTGTPYPSTSLGISVGL
jgi:hypothetical protein